jgi:predicted dehydrogenase
MRPDDYGLPALRGSPRLAINHQMRFMEQYLVARRIIESEEFGPWTSIAVLAGNIGMAMNGTHYFELLRWLSGESPREVAAWFSSARIPNPRGPQFEDSAGSVRVTTPSGKRLYMEIGADQGHGICVVYAGRAGILVGDELSGQMHLGVRGAEYRDLPTVRYGMPSQDSSLKVAPADAVAPTRSVLEALVAGGDYPSGEDGRAAVATLVAAYISDENGHRPVSIDALPREREFQYP